MIRSENTGFLFRIDPQPGSRVVIVVQSAARPDWDYAFHNARHFLAAPPQLKTFDPLFVARQRLRFRLLANPTRKIDTKSGADGQRRNGKRVPVAGDKLHDWLARHGEAGGFIVDQADTAVQPGYVYVSKEQNAHGDHLRAVRYDGILTVTAPVPFRETLVQGIGPAKAFGFGLLSLAKV